MPEITRTQARNLRNHADFIENQVKVSKFDMSLFNIYDEYEAIAMDKETIHNCKTSACAIGWGPSNPDLPKPKNHECWTSYAERVFGYTEYDFGEGLFGGEVTSDTGFVANNMRLAAKLGRRKDTLHTEVTEFLMQSDDEIADYSSYWIESIVEELPTTIGKQARSKMQTAIEQGEIIEFRNLLKTSLRLT